MASRLPMSAATCALLILGADAAFAQQRVGGGMTLPGVNVFPPQPPQSIVHRTPGFHGHGGFFPGFLIEREYVPVVVEREIIREVQVAVPAPAAPPPRKAYVLGRSYSSLPGGCMKLIERGASYYICSGDWYRQVGSQYKAVAQP